MLQKSESPNHNVWITIPFFDPHKTEHMHPFFWIVILNEEKTKKSLEINTFLSFLNLRESHFSNPEWNDGIDDDNDDDDDAGNDKST